MEEDPWVEAIPTHYQPGMIVQGKVTKITNFGVFVELEDELEGLLHISELADHKVENPQDVVKQDQELEVKILRVDLDDRKIGLSLKRAMWTSDQDAAASRAEKSAPQGSGGLGGLGDSDALGTDKITFGQGGASTN
jgi:small subunit ribosomal protein S1